ncbi:unnamed protein product [Brassica oleracea var. botrytis]|uniref:Uncharacterized protein n=1 Tax=Brassica oleracea TaxID=3712 RepID=A0A3P6EXT8_BRAOL|nr:unnamed protein product [Brassica oleracea]
MEEFHIKILINQTRMSIPAQFWADRIPQTSLATKDQITPMQSPQLTSMPPLLDL